MYDLLREFADSWGMLAMLLIFLGIVVYAFRPGTKKLYEDISDIPFRNEELEDE